jgi:hypothetical protein
LRLYELVQVASDKSFSKTHILSLKPVDRPREKGDQDYWKPP